MDEAKRVRRMNALLYVLAGVDLIGSVVWWAVDDDNCSLYKWYRSCPEPVNVVLQPLALNLW